MAGRLCIADLPVWLVNVALGYAGGGLVWIIDWPG